jgi:hypothetical protein
VRRTDGIRPGSFILAAARPIPSSMTPRLQLRRTAAALIALTLLSLVAGPAEPARAAGRVLYVATTGADFLPDGWRTAPNDAAHPWRTIAMTIRRARPGDTIVVSGGTYVEAAGWGAVRATSASPIRLVNAPGERVVLMGTLSLVRADHWIVSGINVTYNPAQGRREALVYFDGGTGWQFLNSEVWGTHGVSNIMVTGLSEPARSYRIAGNCVHDQLAYRDPIMNDHQLYLQPGYRSGPGVVERNLFYGTHNGAAIKAAGGNSSTGAAYVSIRYNTMAFNAAGVIMAYGTHHVAVSGNLIGPQVNGTAMYNTAVLGNHLTGVGDRVVANGVFSHPKSVRSSRDSTRPIAASGNVWVPTGFDRARCNGFHPTSAAAEGFGRYYGTNG